MGTKETHRSIFLVVLGRLGIVCFVGLLCASVWQNVTLYGSLKLKYKKRPTPYGLRLDELNIVRSCTFRNILSEYLPNQPKLYIYRQDPGSWKAKRPFRTGLLSRDLQPLKPFRYAVTRNYEWELSKGEERFLASDELVRIPSMRPYFPVAVHSSAREADSIGVFLGKRALFLAALNFRDGMKSK